MFPWPLGAVYSTPVSVVVEQQADWVQLVMSFAGTMIAAIVAFFVASLQHRRQVLQRSREDVARLLFECDHLIEAINCVYYGSEPLEREKIEERRREVELRMEVVRLTAPLKIYSVAAEMVLFVQSAANLVVRGDARAEQVENLVESGIPSKDHYFEHKFQEDFERFAAARNKLVATSVNYTTIAKKVASAKDRLSRKQALRRMRREGIVGCTDGPTIYDRSI